MLVDLVTGCFHLVSILLFSTRVVLPGVVMGFYPMLYLGVLLISCLYKMNTQIHYSYMMLVRKTAIRSWYIRWHLLIDIAVSVLCFLDYFKVDSGVYGLVILLKITDLNQIHSRFSVIVSHYTRKGLILWKLLELLFLNIIIAHIIALIVIGMVNNSVGMVNDSVGMVNDCESEKPTNSNWMSAK